MYKKVVLNDGNIINYSISDGNFIISKGYIKKEKLEKTLTMSISDDFMFEGYPFLAINDFNEIQCLDFIIPTSDPLYRHFLNLLGNDSKIIIVDDMVKDVKQKYMQIGKEQQNIYVSFYNSTENESSPEKFSITVINIMEDGRSNTFQSSINIKERLVDFFKAIKHEVIM